MFILFIIDTKLGKILDMLIENANVKINFKNKINGFDLLKQVQDETIKIVFFDPEYRGILDKMQYGNEGKSRGKERCSLVQMDFDTIQKFFKEFERVLLPSGYLFLWVDKFHLVEGVQSWFKDCIELECVDMITWNKGKIGMGYRTRRKSEYLVIIQKLPKKAKSTWTIHNIPDVWDEKIEKKEHTHQKPLELQKQLILATTNENDFVMDVCSGSYSVLRACEETHRNFIGGDIKFGEELK